MQVLVLGATGQIGRALVEALSRTKHQVTVMVRNVSGAPFPASVRVRQHATFSADAFRAALQGIDHVIYGIGLPEQFTFDPKIFETVNCSLLGVFLEELRKSPIRNLTYLSTYEVFENIDGRIEETHPIADEGHMTPYFQSMVRAYRSVVEFTKTNNVRLTTIHPAAVFGGVNTGDGITAFLENLCLRKWYKVPFITTTRFPVVQADSLSEAITKSIGKPGAFIVCDQMTSLEEIARTTRDYVASYVPVTMPVSLTKIGVLMLEQAAKLIRVKPFASTVQLDFLTKGWEPIPDKAIRELPWTPLSLREGIMRYVSAGGGRARAARPTGVPLHIIARLQFLTAAGLLIYWPLFFTIGLAPEVPPFGYFVFQHSFVVPDVMLGIAFIRAASWLLSEDFPKRRRGRSLSLVCSGALLFLGMLDISFNVINSFYSLLPLDTIVELAVNAWCMGFGVTSAVSCAARIDDRNAPPGG
jgi:nucleoside-diphosphate-sugar epimerase